CHDHRHYPKRDAIHDMPPELIVLCTQRPLSSLYTIFTADARQPYFMPSASTASLGIRSLPFRSYFASARKTSALTARRTAGEPQRVDLALRAPDGDGDAPTRDQHAVRLRKGALGVRHQHEPEPADHPVEGQTFEGEALGVHLVELRVPHAEGARPGTGPPQHGRGEVHARYQAARPHAAGDGEGRLARSGGHVQHPHARTDPGQLDQPAAERTELRQDNVGVATGELIPHLPFVLLVGCGRTDSRHHKFRSSPLTFTLSPEG